MVEPRDVTEARRALGRQLARYRKSAGFNQHQLAPLTGYVRSTVANVEVGRQNVPRAFWARCDELLDTGGALVRGHDQLETLITRLRRETAELGAQRATTRDTPAAAGPEPLPRGERLDFTLRRSGRVDLVAVAQLRERVHWITSAYDSVPSVSLLADVGRCQGQIAMLGERAAAGLVRRELLAVEAESATLMGQLVWDASQRRDHATALAHFDHAIAAAQQIQDSVAEAHAVLRKSYVALYGTRKPSAGLALAGQAARISQDASHALTGLALLHVAEAYGMLGDRAGCEHAMREAQARLAERDSMDAASEVNAPPQFGRMAGSCYLSLGLPAKAEAYLADSARAMPNSPKVAALVLGNLTLAYLQQRKLDQATATLHEAIDIAERTRGGGGINVIYAAGRALRPWRQEPAVQGVYDRLLALMANA